MAFDIAEKSIILSIVLVWFQVVDVNRPYAEVLLVHFSEAISKVDSVVILL